MSLINKNNVKIHGNQQSGKTIVLGHGFGTDHTAWRFIIPVFAEEYKIITYDNVGASVSTIDFFSSSRYNTLHAYAEDLIDLCDYLKVKQSVFIGHSVSGMVGLLASLKAPEAFENHVFINSSPRYLNDENYHGGFGQNDLDELFSAMSTNYFAWVSGFAPVISGESHRKSVGKEFEKTLLSIRPDIALSVAKSIFESDHRKELNHFRKKSLIIQSRNDIAVPVFVGNYIQTCIPESRLSVIETSGHFPHISDPELIAQTIFHYLS